MRRLYECLTTDYSIRHGMKPSIRQSLLAFLIKPGFRALVYYRLAGYLKGSWVPSRLGSLLAAMVLARLARVPGVEMGSIHNAEPGLFLPHPHDIVIGYGARIGERVTIYNGVTLGARRIIDPESHDALEANYPIIEDGVTLFSGAKILGPVTIGRNSTVAANAVVLESCPPHSVLVGVPAKILRARPGEETPQQEESDRSS